MSRIDSSAFHGKEIELIFFGTSMKECLAAEAALDSAAVDYMVEVEEIDGGPFTGPIRGAAFYVLAGQAEYCKRWLESEGLLASSDPADK